MPAPLVVSGSGGRTSPPLTYPIELRDFTFQIYSRYLNTFKKVLWKRSRGGAEDETAVIRLSQSAFDGITSLPTHLYTKCGLNKHLVSKKLWAKLAVYKHGSGHNSAKEKNNLGISTVKKKKHLPLAAYRKLARLLIESPEPQDIFAHTFLVLE